MNTITLTVGPDRPDYLTQTLDALARCEGRSDWRLYVIADSPSPEVLRILDLRHGTFDRLMYAETPKPLPLAEMLTAYVALRDECIRLNPEHRDYAIDLHAAWSKDLGDRFSGKVVTGDEAAVIRSTIERAQDASKDTALDWLDIVPDQTAVMFGRPANLPDPYARVSRNTHNVWAAAFRDGADAILHLEEDILLAPDALQWASYFAKGLVSAAEWFPELFAAGLWGVGEPGDGTSIHDTRHETRPFLYPWGLVITKERWQEVEPTWDFHHWDRGLQALRGDRLMVYPLISRCQSIGRERGITEAGMAAHSPTFGVAA